MRQTVIFLPLTAQIEANIVGNSAGYGRLDEGWTGAGDVGKNHYAGGPM
jgi:hypothetical protein